MLQFGQAKFTNVELSLEDEDLGEKSCYQIVGEYESDIESGFQCFIAD